MSKVVLDASALLALLNNEPGAEKLSLKLLADAVISSVNLAEVQSHLVKAGINPAESWEAATAPIAEVAAFTAEQAKIAGSLTALTRALGLSLGDRACLALAIAINAPVYTADRAWKNLRLGVTIHTIR